VAGLRNLRAVENNHLIRGEFVEANAELAGLLDKVRAVQPEGGRGLMGGEALAPLSRESAR
jgi:hypothetical protein